MTLNEDECSQKWNLISKKLSELDILISELATSHKNVSIAEPKNFDLAQLHLSAAFAMTELEKVKLRFTVNNLELKDHPIQIEEDRVLKYIKKVKKSGDIDTEEKRPFRIDSDASKRTILHYTE